MIHEFLHAFGAIHEHNRPDRDSHIQINWDNVDISASSQFFKTSWPGMSSQNKDCWQVSHDDENNVLYDDCVDGNMEIDQERDLGYDLDSIMHYDNYQ